MRGTKIRGNKPVVRISHVFEPKSNLGIYMDGIPRALSKLSTEDI
jgi:hypothetical protein